MNIAHSKDMMLSLLTVTLRQLPVNNSMVRSYRDVIVVSIKHCKKENQ